MPDGFFRKKRYLIHDRYPLYTREFPALLLLPELKQSNPATITESDAYAERFVRSIKESCLDQMIFFGEDALRNTIREFITHYHTERNHQGLENRLIVPLEMIGTAVAVVKKRERVGGLLNYYYREAA